MTVEPKVAIIGAGPVGGILGAHLANAGHYVVFCDIQKPHLDAIKERGVSITGFLEMTAECERVAYSISELSNFPAVNTIIIATKSAILPRILPEIEKVAQPGTKFVSCQNGLDNEEYLAETFDADNVMRIVVNYGGSQMGDGHFAMSFFNPPNYIGAMTPESEAVARRLAEMATESTLITAFTTEIKKYEWEKVILNSALNPVCALTRKPMKDMMDFELTESLAEAILREGVKVAGAAGITFDEGFVEHGVRYLKGAGYHRTSMHQDIIRNIPSEIDWISCKIVEWGRRYNVETPYNHTIAALVKGLEIKSAAPNEH
ncbi:MAG: ketopantoate reductase family protein [Chloroflexi bacterium]|nr:ketopantoate reductase family protein [Chloroflexota bacterium]